jgi:hypothetical protein
MVVFSIRAGEFPVSLLILSFTQVTGWCILSAMPHSTRLNPTSTIECYSSKIARRLSVVCAVWIVFCLLAPPARPCTTPTGAVTNPPGNSSGNFFTNFVQGFPSTYAIQMSFNAPSGLPGDLNAGYAELYYSLYNQITSWQAAGYCPIEVVLAGTFPDVRYFSVVDNDDHLAGTEHIADLGLDPVGWSGTFPYDNPFVVGLDQSPGTLGGVSGGSLPYNLRSVLVDAAQPGHGARRQQRGGGLHRIAG